MQTSPVEAVHAWEYVELLTKEGLEALITLLTGVNFNAPVFNHAQLIFELFCIGRIAVHKRLEPSNFLGVVVERLTNFVLEVFYLDVLVEVGQ